MSVLVEQEQREVNGLVGLSNICVHMMQYIVSSGLTLNHQVFQSNRAMTSSLHEYTMHCLDKCRPPSLVLPKSTVVLLALKIVHPSGSTVLSWI